MEVNFNKRDPVYVQVVQHFKQEIANGNLAPGEEIPSRRELARKLKINPNTAQRAYKEMEEANLIYTEGNLPSTVTTDKKVILEVREELLLTAVNIFVNAIRPINIPVDELLQLVKIKYTSDNEDGEGLQ